jgi:hypothetical protein
MAAYFRKYGTATHIYLPMIKRGAVDYAVGADWSPAAGDVKISIDGGTASNVTNLPAAITMGNTAQWDFSLTSGELSGKKITISVADSSTKAVEDQFFDIETYGNASAEYQADLSAANLPADLKLWMGTAPLALSSQQVQAVVPDGQKVDVNTVKTQAVTCAAGVTVLANLGTAASNTAQTGDAYAIVNSGTFGNSALKSLVDSALAALTLIDSDTGTLVTNVSALPTTTKLLKLFQLALRKDAAIATDNAAELAEINANGGSGAGSFASTTDSQQALRDNYTTGGDTLLVAPISAVLQGNIIVSSGETQCFQYTSLPSGPIAVTDANGPIDVGSDDLKLIAIDVKDPAVSFTLLKSADQLTVGGEDSNQVSLEYVVELAGRFKWHLFRQPTGLTPWQKVAYGFFNVEEGPDPSGA